MTYAGATCSAEVVDLTGVRLPDHASVTRDVQIPSGSDPDGITAKYDFRTLVYDCFEHPGWAASVAVAPPFLNLWDNVKAHLMVDGRRVDTVQRLDFGRCDCLVIPHATGDISMEIAGQRQALPTRKTLRHAFAGLNAIVSINRDNKLTWIADWARYYVARHGAQAVVLFDNGSETYRPSDIARVLGDVEGLQKAVVFSAPFPFGAPVGRPGRKERNSAEFFQTAMLNIARLDALAEARSVLNVDIDELVHAPGDRSIFDAAVAHPLGMVTIKGYYAYPKAPEMIPADHAAHVYREATVKQCNRKWCVAPAKWIGRNYTWDRHKVGGLLQNLFTEQRTYSHIHCYGTTTGWKAKRRGFDRRLVVDPDLERLMRTYFSP